MAETEIKSINGMSMCDTKARSSIPTTLASLADDSTHRTVSDTEKSNWNKKASTDVATASANGLMSKEDKVKMDSIAAGANKTVVDSTLSDTSTNPVQNKILKAELDKKINSDEIKTINGESIIGDGNIQIEADVSLISRVEKTADDTTVSLDPNTLYVFPEMTSLSISLNAPKDTSIVNEYHFIFESGTTATTFSLPDNLKVDAYSIDANKIYEVSILESICYVRGVASA